MWWILLLSCWQCPLSWSMTWYPLARLNTMLGEQIDLVGANNATYAPWIRSTANNGVNDAESIDSGQSPVNSVDRDREPLDEVERIEPRQWPGRPDILPTRSTAPFTTEGSLLPRFPQPTTLAQRNPSTQRYPTITAPPPTVVIDEAICDFEPNPSMPLCEWQNGNGALDWTLGTGINTNWLGGPSMDASGTMEGGYAFLETSQIPLKNIKFKSQGGLLHSPQLGSTGVTGTCLMFKYAMDGLSIAGLRVLLHVGADEFSFKKEQPEELPVENVTSPASCEPEVVEVAEERVLWHAQYYTLGVWQDTQILYTYPELHSVVIEGIPVDSTDPSRLYRGYIAIDDIDLQSGTLCTGFCNFAGGFCDWNNDAEDDFDWTISRGSANPATGPAMDSSSDRATAGGYAFIDSSFPRRPGDTAKLLSSTFSMTSADSPMCMHFWFHMFGSGVGYLKLFIRHFRSSDNQLQEIWGLSGNAGNAWFMSQVTISSLDDFQLVFEASVGNTGMGDIAIDDISYGRGACPVSPQVAGPIPRDCTFEVDECDWINSRDPDRVEWERVSTQVLGPRNQRKPYSNGHTVNRRNEYFLGLGRLRGGPRSSGGGTAQLVSREMTGSEEPLCITFWYFMFEPFIDSTGPSLGVLRLYVQAIGDLSTEAKPIWQLYNNQGPTWNYAQASITEKANFNIIIEGIWGPNRASGNIGIDDIAFYIGDCSVKPLGATVRAEDCSFEKGLCGWENITASDDNRAVMWQRAFLTHRPAQLLDRTFGATGEFVFFDIFTTNKESTKVQLRSPVIAVSPDEEFVCFTFWFAAFGVEESTALRVIKVPAEDGNEDNENEQEQSLWSLTAKGFNTPRPVWMAAQVTIEARTSYRLILEGSASNGGFAVDDIKFQPLACESKNKVETSVITMQTHIIQQIVTYSFFFFSVRPTSAQPVETEASQ
ncbi:MAM and LDL-receptor class A domain-containing protein 1-like isoform X2 [Pseudomyrmex gracilis]|uniref:MAM and LDL-receptor class A domain-containing protein 1-like isoform X2 n=1 Tax=Pseudomyrmex gracilis TaxID=219809 RepID=UPI000995CE5A|nr:MAM and LDL-receptor class A domain-containing protein 1-like isoform X2 [Pseudomyrmex gracilis]